MVRFLTWRIFYHFCRKPEVLDVADRMALLRGAEDEVERLLPADLRKGGNIDPERRADVRKIAGNQGLADLRPAFRRARASDPDLYLGVESPRHDV